MVAFNTKMILYMKRSDGVNLRLYDVLKFYYNQMLNDEYDSEITQQTERFETRWEKNIWQAYGLNSSEKHRLFYLVQI